MHLSQKIPTETPQTDQPARPSAWEQLSRRGEERGFRCHGLAGGRSSLSPDLHILFPAIVFSPSILSLRRTPALPHFILPAPPLCLRRPTKFAIPGPASESAKISLLRVWNKVEVVANMEGQRKGERRVNCRAGNSSANTNDFRGIYIIMRNINLFEIILKKFCTADRTGETTIPESLEDKAEKICSDLFTFMNNKTGKGGMEHVNRQRFT